MALEKIVNLVKNLKDKIVPRSNISKGNRVVEAYFYRHNGSLISPDNRMVGANLGKIKTTRGKIDDIMNT